MCVCAHRRCLGHVPILSFKKEGMAAPGGMPPPAAVPLSAVGSATTPTFAEAQKRAYENSQNGVLMPMMDDDDPLIPAEQLNAMPASSAASGSVAGEEDDRRKVILEDLYPEQISKTAKIKALIQQKEDIREARAGETPREILFKHYESVQNLPLGSQRKEFIELTNHIVALYDACRYNFECRDLCAKLFYKLQHHIDGKTRIAAIDTDIKYLNELYDDVAEQKAMQKIAIQRAKRMADAEEKALEERADKMGKKAKKDDKKKVADNNKQKKMDTSS